MNSARGVGSFCERRGKMLQSGEGLWPQNRNEKKFTKRRRKVLSGKESSVQK